MGLPIKVWVLYIDEHSICQGVNFEIHLKILFDIFTSEKFRNHWKVNDKCSKRFRVVIFITIPKLHFIYFYKSPWLNIIFKFRVLIAFALDKSSKQKYWKSSLSFFLFLTFNFQWFHFKKKSSWIYTYT